MYYIRFLKAPRVLSDRPAELTARIVVTTDLGEAFLAEDVELEAGLEAAGVPCGHRNAVLGLLWRGSSGMRSLDVRISLPNSLGGNDLQNLSVYVRRRGGDWKWPCLRRASKGDYAREDMLLVGVCSPVMQVPSMALRRFTHSVKDWDVEIWEEMGESIARHIW